MTIRRALLCAAVPALVAAAGYSARGVLSAAPPAIVFPETIELGDVDQGQVVTQRLSIANRGGSPLEIGNVHTNCSCSGLEREMDGAAESVTELTIPPGAAVELRVRLAARGQPGMPMRTVLAFGTNDPNLPVCQIDLVVSRIRGIAPSPAAVVFGAVPIGPDPTQVVELRDLAGDRLAIETASSSNPNRFIARLLPGAEAAGDVARIEVAARAATPGAVTGEIRVEVRTTKGPKVVTIPVMVHVLAAVEACPSRVCLPRSSADGPLYGATCLCRTASGKPFRLTTEAVPDGLSVVVPGGSKNSPTQFVRIEWTGTRELTESQERVIRLKAQVGSDQFPVEVHVACKPSGAE